MKATLIVNGKEIEVEISEEEVEAMIEKKRTGYERANKGKDFYFVEEAGGIRKRSESNVFSNRLMYDLANYYSDRTVAENNARADTLMRRLRRFAVEHREKNLVWESNATGNWVIYFNHQQRRIMSTRVTVCQTFNTPYFSSVDEVKAAIEAFHDELMWYFTEYHDSLGDMSAGKCSCYHYENGGRCWGTKEIEQCSCGGDTAKCDFYPEKR